MQAQHSTATEQPKGLPCPTRKLHRPLTSDRRTIDWQRTGNAAAANHGPV